MTDLRDEMRGIIEFWEDDITDDDVMDFPAFALRKAISRSDDFKLYRYMSPRYYNIRNIETQKIHMSENGVMNDIFEGLPETDVRVDASEIEQLHDLVKMTCFTETNDNILMWSHYTDDHKGFCVEYDLKRIKNDQFGLLKHLFPIIYRDKRFVMRDMDSLIDSHKELRNSVDGNYEYDGRETLSDILPMFLTKACCWSYEKEWRIIYTLKQMYDFNDRQLYSGNLEFPCISAVYLGYRIDPEIKAHITEICKRLRTDNYEVEVYQAKLAKTRYSIEFERVGT